MSNFMNKKPMFVDERLKVPRVVPRVCIKPETPQNSDLDHLVLINSLNPVALTSENKLKAE